MKPITTVVGWACGGAHLALMFARSDRIAALAPVGGPPITETGHLGRPHLSSFC